MYTDRDIIPYFETWFGCGTEIKRYIGGAWFGNWNAFYHVACDMACGVGSEDGTGIEKEGWS